MERERWSLKLVEKLVTLTHRNIWVTEIHLSSITINSGRYWSKLYKLREIESER